MLKEIKRNAKLWCEAFTAGIGNTGNVTATVGGKKVLSWHGTPTQKDDILKMLPVVQQRMMPGVSPETFADAMIAGIHDEGIAQDSLGCNIQSIVMLWRLFTTPVDREIPDFTYGDLVALKNFHVAFELHEQPNDQFKVTWVVNTTLGRNVNLSTKRHSSMAARLGDVLYWAFSAVAVGLLLLAAVFSMNDVAGTYWFYLAFFGVPAVLVWLVGRACRYVLAAR
ncbi:MAG TPA: hypothetical protein VIY68_04200 [Steroidobacteraceae bacterium]